MDNGNYSSQGQSLQAQQNQLGGLGLQGYQPPRPTMFTHAELVEFASNRIKHLEWELARIKGIEAELSSLRALLGQGETP